MTFYMNKLPFSIKIFATSAYQISVAANEISEMMTGNILKITKFSIDNLLGEKPPNCFGQIDVE